MDIHKKEQGLLSSAAPSIRSQGTQSCSARSRASQASKCPDLSNLSPFKYVKFFRNSVISPPRVPIQEEAPESTKSSLRFGKRQSEHAYEDLFTQS